MSVNTTVPQSGRWRWISLGFLAVFFVLLWPLLDGDQTLDVYSVELPAWLLGLVFYVLGAAAMWATLKAPARGDRSR